MGKEGNLLSNLTKIPQILLKNWIQNFAIMSDEDPSAEQDREKSIATETGITYDERMTEHHCLWDDNYPERPERFSLPLQRCREYGLIDRCVYIPCRRATKEEIQSQHSEEIIELVQNTQYMTNTDDLERLSSKYDAIYFHPATYELACLAAGGTIDLVTEVVTGKLKNGMGIIRPPGHHAMYNEPCGYCFFNNVAIAAKHAVENLGLERVLIVDWDVHHGQASQYMFYNDPRVLYFSIHRYEHGEFWPNLRESNYDFIGEEKGKGFNFNIPLNKTGMGNSEYTAIFHQVLLPVAYEFSPELVLISSGYDAAVGCFEGCMEVTPSCYAHLLTSLMGLAEGKVCVFLEGGYCLQSLSEGVALTLRALLGDPCPPLGPLGEPNPEVVTTILDVIYVHHFFWKCFQYQGEFQDLNEESKQPRHIPEIKFLGTTEKPESYETRSCYPVQSLEEILQFRSRIDELIANTKLTVPQIRTCLAYDKKMLLHRRFKDFSHPENPDRLIWILKKFEKFKILDRCQIAESRFASEEELAMLHQKHYIEEMKRTQTLKQKELEKIQKKFQSIYLCEDTYTSALMAAGCLFQLVERVLTGQVQNGIAVIRPPGHHAMRNEPNGFCFFNNVALAAQMAVTKYKLERVLILDWDVHHGDGTQSMFEDNPKILYISLHRYDYASFFPFSENANYDKVGKGNGVGFNINIPWNKGGKGDGDYISAFHHVILPIAYQYNPELVLVSAGFDAAQGDPLGGCRITPEGYSQMTHLLSSLANGRIILALEGGYNLESLSESLSSCAKVLLGDPCPSIPGKLTPSPSAVSSILHVLKTQKQFWSCLKYQVDFPKTVELKTKDVENSCGKITKNGEEKSIDEINMLVSKLGELVVMKQCDNL